MNKLRRALWALSGCVLTVVWGTYVLSVLSFRQADASRNSSGTYSLATSAVTSNQVIGSSLWNSTFSDLASSMTDSLDRNGRGGMLAALRGIDGTLAAPALSFTSETGSGLFRNGAGDVRMSILGALRENWTSTGVAVTGTLSATDVISNSASGTATNNLGQFFEASLASGNYARVFVGKSTSANSGGFLSFQPNATAALSTTCIATAGQNDTFCVDGNGKATVGIGGGSLQIGASGTAISASYRGTAANGLSVVSTGTCVLEATITLTGATAGTECMTGNSAPTTGLIEYCKVTANTCSVFQCNIQDTGNITPGASTLACRVFNP